MNMLERRMGKQWMDYCGTKPEEDLSDIKSRISGEITLSVAS